ncbi:MAG: hypothetical protein JNK26_03615 [Candidatus Doudnabacteria bacterium]|nr:hypothetical protein [Candidatus Doudnabacteria bacterium]
MLKLKTSLFLITLGFLVTFLALVPDYSKASALGYTNPPETDRKKWAPQEGSVTIGPAEGGYKIRSEFKWTDVSGFQKPHTFYEHEVIFYNWNLFDCKYDSEIVSNLVQEKVGPWKFKDLHKPLKECISPSVTTNLENAYIDTRLFDKDADGEAYTVGTLEIPEVGKDYFIEFLIELEGGETDSEFQVEGSLGHAAGTYATPLQFNPFEEIAFCIGAFWIPVDAACVFRSSPENQIFVERQGYNKDLRITRSWNLTNPLPGNPLPPAPPPVCSGKSNGTYCGASLGLNPNALFLCQDNVATAIQACSNGCSVQPPGTDDYCSPTPSGGSACPNNQSGIYCGTSVGLDPNTLYNCQNGVKTPIQSCALGCIQKPPGTADVCRAPSAGSCPAGTGDYCGSTLGLDPNTLFYCEAGNVSIKQQCSNGCKLMPAGTADICYPPGTGGGGNTGDKVVLYGDSNYGANTIRVQAGVGDSEEPSRGSAYKSMTVPSGWSVILSDQNLGLVGATKCFSQSEPNLESIGWAFSIESMKVYGTNVCPTSTADGIRICRQTGISDCMTVAQDIPSLGSQGFGNDTLKSVELGGDWELVLFEDDNYGGRRYITGTNTDMGNTPFGYNTSSVQVRKREPAAFTLYHLGDYNGGNFKSDRTVSDLSFWDSFNAPADQKWNDNAQSIRVSPGYEVVACTDGGFHGVCGRTNHDNGDLNSVAQGLRNGLSSVQVCLGSCAPTSVPPALISPEDGEKFGPGTPVTFSWSGNGDQYVVEYWGGTFGNTIQSTGWRSDILATTVNNLAISTEPYFWRVRSWTPVGDSGWSPTYSFHIQDVAPVQIYIDGPTQVDLNTPQEFTALVSPSNAGNLQFIWSPAPKSGQGTANAVYDWGSVGEQTVSVSAQNSGGIAESQLIANVACPHGKYLAEYFDNQTLTGEPVDYSCEDKIEFDWGTGGPSVIPSMAFNLGNGADGELNIATGQTEYTDNVRTHVLNSALSGDNAVCVASTLGFKVGDEIMIVQSMGNQAGNYDFAKISHISFCWITLESAIANSYLTPNSSAQVLKVPHYTDVNVSGKLTVHPWDGRTGGVMAFRANGSVNLQSGGTIDATGTGFRGGARTVGAAAIGIQGEGLNGQGSRTRVPNEPGGGGAGPGTGDGGAGAGGGAHRSPGGNAKDPFYGDPGLGSTVTYGEENLSKLFFGGAGGSGGTDDSGGGGGFGGRGGNGGGIIYIEANKVLGTGSILSNGENGEDHNGVPDSEHGGGGGGAGGSIKILADKINTDSITIASNGGAGGKAKDGTGGSGGVGQAFIQYCEISGIQALLGNSLQLPNCEKDNFSVRWTGNINFPNLADYIFSVKADDGVRLFIDDMFEPVIDEWIDGSNISQVRKNLEAGDHTVKVEYYENGGLAEAHLSIQEVVPPQILLTQIPGQTVNYGRSFIPIKLSDYITNFEEQSGLGWQVSGNVNIDVSIVNNVATLTVPAGWDGAEEITFTATNEWGRTASSTAEFKVLPLDCPGQYVAQYFNNTDLAGIPALTRCENSVKYDWGKAAPAPRISADNFSVVWKKQFNVPISAIYSFITQSDDGIRLYVDNILKLDHWSDHSWATDRVDVGLEAGEHEVRVEYYEKTGLATAILDISIANDPPVVKQIPIQKIYQGESFQAINLADYGSDPNAGDEITWSYSGNKKLTVEIVDNVATLSYPNTWFGDEIVVFKATDKYGASASISAKFSVGRVVDCPVGQYKAEYFNNPLLRGLPVHTRCESIPQYDWGVQAPLAGMNADNFSVRWTATLRLTQGYSYQFATTSDDGVRLLLDNVVILNNWTDHAAMTDVVTKKLDNSLHTIRMEYYERGGAAIAKLSITQIP